MKIYVFIISLFFASCAGAQPYKIVGGAGIIKTNCNPNNVISLYSIDERFYSAFARDTVTQVLYVYDRALPISARWRPFLPEQTEFDTTRIIWNGGNYNTGGITIGAKQNANINFITNNVVRGTWTNIGLAIGASQPFGHSFYAVGSTSLGSLQVRDMLPATDYSQIVVRNANDNYLYKAPAKDFLEASYLQNLDTMFAWAGRVYNCTPTTRDIVITSRLGIQSVTDSIVFNFDFIPSKNQEINIYTQGNAKLWVMDVIFRCKNDASTGYSLFEEGNGLYENFEQPRAQQCIEFGIVANNPNYQGHFFNVESGTLWKITLKYNSINKRWLVTKTGRFN